MPLEDSFLRSTVSDLTWSALKQTEDGEDLAVRAYNSSSVPRELHVALACPVAGVWRSRLDEGRLEAMETGSGGGVRLPVGPGGVVTFRIHTTGGGGR